MTKKEVAKKEKNEVSTNVVAVEDDNIETANEDLLISNILLMQGTSELVKSGEAGPPVSPGAILKGPCRERLCKQPSLFGSKSAGRV